jgi:hypothetical protein
MADESKIIKDVSASVDKLTGSFSALQKIVASNLTQQKEQITYINSLKKALSGEEFKNFVKIQGDLQKVQAAVSKQQKIALDLASKEEQVKQQALKTQQAAIRAAEAEAIAKQKVRQATANAEKSELSLDQQKKKGNKTSQEAAGRYKEESDRLRKLTKDAKDAAMTYGLNSKEARKLTAEQQKLDTQIKKVDASLGIHNRNVGNYGSALGKASSGFRTLMGAFGVTLGLRSAIQLFKSAITQVKEYEKANAVLAGILGKTRKETVKLQKDSQRLGATTAFTAKQVTELQIELARLGKTEDEIIGMTGGIIDASIAMQSNIADTATLVGATLNTFSMEARRSSYVADVFTKSTQSTALSFEKLNTAIPIAAGAAAAAKVPFELMVAQLGQAADRGIDASTSATSLRNIYITLAAKGMTFAEAMKQINESQNKLNTATEIFDKRSAITALALAATTEKAKDLQKALEESGGTAKRVAEEQLNTLDGALTILTSTWEGFIQTVTKTGAAKMYVEGLTSAIDNLRKKIIGANAVGQEMGDEIIAYIEGSSENTSESVKRLTGQIETFKEAIIELQKYRSDPSWLARILQPAQAAGAIEQSKKFEAENTERYNALISSLEKKLSELRTKLADEEKERKIAEIDLSKMSLDEITKLIDNYQGAYNSLTDAQKIYLEAMLLELGTREKLNNELSKTVELTDEEKRALEDAAKERAKTIEKLKEYSKERDEDEDVKVPAWIIAESDAISEESELFRETLASDTKFLEDQLKERDDVTKAEMDKLLEYEKEISDKKKELFTTAANSYFEVEQEKYDKAIEANTAYYDNLLSNELLDEEQRDLLEAQKEAKENEIERKKRESEKKQFLFNQGFKVTEIVMDTLQKIAAIKATAAVLAANPLTAFAAPFALAQIPLVNLSSGLSIGTILAQTIPQLDKGTENTPSKYIAGEKRPEIRIKDGKASIVNKPTIFENDPGSKIISGVDTARIMDNINNYSTQNIITEGKTITRDDKIVAQLVGQMIKEQKNGTDRIITALGKRKQSGTSEINRLRTQNLKNKLKN